MIGIVVALGNNDSFAGLQEHLPVPLLALADKPFLQHIVEYLAGQQVTRIEFILSHLPEKIEHAMGDGARWGCRFHYHLAGPNADPLKIAAGLTNGVTEAIVLANAERLPAVDLVAIQPGTVVTYQGNWTKWGVFSAADLARGDFDNMPRVEAEACLNLESGRAYLDSQRLVLEQKFPCFLISGRQADPGIWIARNVALHPTAKVTPPVFIGENCRIGASAQIGPSAVIGQNCIIDSHTIVTDSMVAAGTYVGEGLELDSVIVDRNRLLNVRLETSLLTGEAFLLGALTDRAAGRTSARLISFAIALLLFLVLWPLWLLARLYVAVAGTVSSIKIVQIPAEDDPASWREADLSLWHVKGARGGIRDFFFHLLPGLLSVLKGDLYLVGVPPRTREQVEQLSSDWKFLYLRTKVGLVTEAAVMFGENPSEDDLYTAEAFYSATESLGHDLRLLGLWLWQLFVRLPRSAAEAE